MKSNVFIICILVHIFIGCQKNDTSGFDAIIDSENISFTPIAGGAIMHYVLPDNDDIMGICVRYQDAFGNEILRTGSYACDSLFLLGFNEACQNVEAKVSLCNRNNVESESIDVIFSTKDSAPVAFFNQLKVEPSWNGFQVLYNVPQVGKGLAHVFYIGKSPLTGETDTLLLDSFEIKPGADTLFFTLQQSATMNDVVIRTEDFRGYMAKQKVFQGVEAYESVRLEPTLFEFLDENKLSIEDDEYQLGYKYLFDGDIKGETCLNLDQDHYKTYLAGPRCLGKDLFIIDLKERKKVAEMRFYSMLNMRTNFPEPPSEIWNPNPKKYGAVWASLYYNKIPCEIVVYATNTKDDVSSWKKIASFKQNRDVPNNERWCARCPGADFNYALYSLEEIDAAKPCFLSLHVSAMEDSYRYLKVVVNDHYASLYPTIPQNPEAFLILHELEIFVKK